MLTRAEIELEFVREFSHSGAQLGAIVSSEERRERIRVAILVEQKQADTFRDSGMSYRAAYEFAYHKPIELRRFPRVAQPAPIKSAPVIVKTEDDEDEDWEDGDESEVAVEAG